MKQETAKKLNEYVEKNTKPFSGITNAVKEIENMHKAKVSSKKFHEMNEKREFYPRHPAIKSVQRKSHNLEKKQKMAKKMHNK